MATPAPRPVSRPVPRVWQPARRWPRLEPEHHALVSAVSEAGAILRGQVLDLSAGGVCCQLHSEAGLLGNGEEVLLKISFFGRAGTLRAIARVVWSCPEGGGRPSAHYGLAWIEGADLGTIRRLLELEA